MRNQLALLIVAMLLGGCYSAPPPDIDADRVLHMAGEEAGQIGTPKERFTRQLNIANRENYAGRQADARVTLGKARETLEKADKGAFTDQDRLAGWVSLSELAREADDKAFANSALDQALAALNELNPQQERCQYVQGVEHEVRELRGQQAAAKLLITAGDWAMEIPAQPGRRGAFYAFARELFSCNDYEAGRAMLHRDPDAAWRSDMLVAMSDRARRDGEMMRGSFFSSGSAVASEAPSSGTRTISAPEDFGKRLDFKSNYYRP